MMLLFLDIDGVMVPAKGWQAPVLLQDGFPAFSKSATKMLQGLITNEVTVLLTTSHKSRYTKEEWRTIFKNRGIEIENLTTLPTAGTYLSRKEEIVNWFKMNVVGTNFLIIDDDSSLQELPLSLKANWVQPSPTVGLNESHTDLINSILTKGTPVL
ncbi:MAG: HAD domain-containing protein [Bacteroidota bacterium]